MQKILSTSQVKKSSVDSIQQENFPETFDHDYCFVIDIDGTLILSHQQIPGSSQTLNLLTQLNHPFILLTNNIAQNQEDKATEVNEIMTKLNKKIDGKTQVIINYTPIKEQYDWQNMITFIVGRQARLDEILPVQFIKNKYITIEEYCTIFVESVPLSRRKYDDHAQEVKRKVQQRLGIKNIQKNTLKFGVILIMSFPCRWQQSYQVIIDLLNSPDGTYNLNSTSYTYHPTHIPVITTLNDLLFRTKQNNLPRIFINQFNEGLKLLFKAVYNEELKIDTYGKPEKKVFKWTERFCEKNFGKTKKYIMIGDNLDVDIKGARNCGWDTILVKTGVEKQDSDIATINAYNIEEGINKYLMKQKQGLLDPEQKIQKYI